MNPALPQVQDKSIHLLVEEALWDFLSLQHHENFEGVSKLDCGDSVSLKDTNVLRWGSMH